MNSVNKGKMRMKKVIDALESKGVIVEKVDYKFSDARRWKLDLAWPSYKVAVEIDGGNWLVRKSRAIGRHAHAEDYKKRNMATLLGWKVLAFTGYQVDRDMDYCLQTILDLLQIAKGIQQNSQDTPNHNY